LRPPDVYESEKTLEGVMLALKVGAGPVVSGIVWVVTSVIIIEEFRWIVTRLVLACAEVELDIAVVTGESTELDGV
jgi:hypothetical protein